MHRQMPGASQFIPVAGCEIELRAVCWGYSRTGRELITKEDEDVEDVSRVMLQI